MENNYFEEQAIDQKIDHVLVTIKRVVFAIFMLGFFVLAFALILEVKREYSIDLVHGVNFSIDDWYFNNIVGGSK